MTDKKKAPAAKKAEDAPRRVHFNQLQFKDLKRDYERARGILQVLIDKYNELGAGKADEKVLRAITTGGIALENIKKAYMEKMKADVSETTKNPVLAAKLMGVIEEPFDQWAAKAKETRSVVENLFNSGLPTAGFVKYLHWHYFQLDNGKVSYDQKALEVDCSIYLDTDNRREFMELAEQTVKQLQKLHQMAKDYASNGYPANIIPGSLEAGYLFNYDDAGDIILSPEWIESIQ